MAKLIYSAIASADGYVEDAAGSFGWAAPPKICSASSTTWSGRQHLPLRAPDVPGQPPSVRAFTRIWQAADKIVFSTTLQSVSSTRTRIERTSIRA